MQTSHTAVREEARALYSAHHGWLQGWLRRRLGNAAEAADLAHDVFLRLLTRRQPVRANEPRAFLSTVAQRVLIDHWRRRELEQAWLDTLAALPPGEVPSAEAQAMVWETLVAVDQVLAGLTPAVRRAFLWNQLEGVKCPEIARQLGVSLATAERYVAKALKACYTLRFEA